MSEKINDGGPAFPMPEQQFTGGMDGYYGMSLRDYFAAKAMSGLYSRVEVGGFERVAKLSYELADAMIAARSKS